MSVVQTIFGVLLALFCIVIILVVLLQEGHQKIWALLPAARILFLKRIRPGLLILFSPVGRRLSQLLSLSL